MSQSSKFSGTKTTLCWTIGSYLAEQGEKNKRSIPGKSGMASQVREQGNDFFYVSKNQKTTSEKFINMKHRKEIRARLER